MKKVIVAVRHDDRRIPEADAIMAAVFSDSRLFDFMRIRPREGVRRRDRFGRLTPAKEGEFVTDRILDVEDVGTLYLILNLVLDAGGEIEISDFAASGRLPDSALPHPPGLPALVSHLHANGYLAVRHESGTAFVSCGPRVRLRCEALGLEMPEPRT